MTSTTKNLIIGFGKAGKTLASHLAKLGEQVTLIEQSEQMYGGTCINIGCIPSKKLIHESQYHSFTEAMHSKDQLITQLRTANYNKLNHESNITVINATAKFQNDNTVILSNGNTITAERIFINTGAVSNIPPITGLNALFNQYIFDSTGILSLNHYKDNAPNHLVIIGGGFIALEFAFMYRAFGSQVTILETADTLIAHQDEDIRQEILTIMARHNIQVMTGVNISEFAQSDNTNNNTDNTVAIKLTQNNQAIDDIFADVVLIATGRKPNTQTLELHNTSIQLTERGFIQVDEHLKAADNIWAMGDVAGSPQFTYISLDDYRIVINQLFGDGNRNTKDRNVFPTSVFINPPLSHIGMTEKQAINANKNYHLLTLKANDIVKAKVINQTDGLLKAIIDKDTGLILGVTLLCAESHELINLFKLAMDYHIPAAYFKSQIFTHPTMAEGMNDLFAGL
ncbi:MAG: FAD-dependent oxidoreductase [Moraxella sp.]|nr:FAD-dependent oxidoreductase [Moraxella sp.]